MKNATEQQALKFMAVSLEHHKILTDASLEDLQWAIQQPREALTLFVNALTNRTKKVAEKVKKTLTPFFTINTGNTTVEQLIADIKANKNENDVADEVSDYSGIMMANEDFIVSKTSGTADLVALSIAELGFTQNPLTTDFMTANFCTKWSRENLDGYVIELCEPDDGQQLHKQWLDQPKGTVVRVCSTSGVFSVERDANGRRWLRGGWTCVGLQWSLGHIFVFRFRKTRFK